jgi:uncharacterized protein DUF4115
MRPVLIPTAYVALGAAAIGLLVLNILAWTGTVVEEPRPQEDRVVVRPAPQPLRPPSPKRERAAAPVTSRPSASTVVLSAVRGDCWLSVRAGGETGAILYEGVLDQGESLRFKRNKLWLRLGAASNLEISVNGKPADVPFGTVEVVLPAA